MKQFFYDANLVKWVLEYVEDERYWWIHVDGDNEKYSGETADTLGHAFENIVTDGYLDEE